VVRDSLVAALPERTMGHYGIVGNAAILRRLRSFRDLEAIARELQAQFVILGQLKEEGAARFVLAHLIRMPDQQHLQVARLRVKEAEAGAREMCQKFPSLCSSQLRP